MGFLTGFLQAAGALLFCFGAYTLAPFLGFALTGLLIFMLGWVLDGGTFPTPKTPKDDEVNGSA